MHSHSQHCDDLNFLKNKKKQFANGIYNFDRAILRRYPPRCFNDEEFTEKHKLNKMFTLKAQTHEV